MVHPGTFFIVLGDNGPFLCTPMKIGAKCEHCKCAACSGGIGTHRRPVPLPLLLEHALQVGIGQRVRRAVADLPRHHVREEQPGYTRARCHSSLAFLVTIGILHIKEIGEGR